jgi:peptidoglycan/LPS O-acetylase OafA/YrhL
LIALVHSRETAIHRFFERPLLVWIGQLSYSLYIWHYPVFAWTRRLHMPRYTTGVLGVALAFAVASLSYYIVERRFLLLKKRFQSP